MKMPIDFMFSQDLKQISKEIDIMRGINHVQVIKLLDLFKDEGNQVYFIMEKYDQSLYEYLKNRTLDEADIIRIFTMICIPLY